MNLHTPELEKVLSEVSLELDIPKIEVEKAFSIYWRAIKAKVVLDEASEHIIPYLGRLVPHKKFVQKLKDEVSNP